ncbi:MAG: pentapeptide repeat-containing protein, partial [Alphaproteobacteria bacterium]
MKAVLVSLVLLVASAGVASALDKHDLETLQKTGSCGGCDLRGVKLQSAKLKEAYLKGANMRDAILKAIDLTNANLVNT